MERLCRRGSQSCRMLPWTRSPAAQLRLCNRLSGRDCECMWGAGSEVCVREVRSEGVEVRFEGVEVRNEGAEVRDKGAEVRSERGEE